MGALTALESAVVTKLLAGEHPLLSSLRAQARVCGVAHREFTGVGFWTTFEVAPRVEPAQDTDFVLEDVGATVDGLEHGLGFNLFVKGGVLDWLEGFTYAEAWPGEIRGFTLHYLSKKGARLEPISEEGVRDQEWLREELAEPSKR